ncbi:MFS transporter [Paenibacillus selenitireducens]|nr:MFS transporter [Paenibacillus selenitireducens]
MILIILNLFTFMATLDGSIVNVALPVISNNLNLAVAQTEWVVTSYLMTICSFILFFGKMADGIGKIKVFRLGAIVFVIGSILCGFSHSLPILVGARIIQAIGASMTMASNMGIVTDIFPAHERGKALGLLGTFVSLGSITGPGLGGFIVSSLGWEYIFWVNVPIGLILIIAGWKLLPDDLSTRKVTFDVTGMITFAVFIISLFTGILIGQQVGYGNPGIVFSLILAVISFALFIWIEIRKDEPMLQLKIFKNSLFSLSILTGFLVFVANFCFNILTPFYMQGILGMSPHEAGLLLMLFPIMMAFVAPLSGALSDRIGSEWLTFWGLILLTSAQIGLMTLNGNSSLIFVGVLFVALGAGNGIFQSPNNSLLMSTVPKNQLGIAGSINGLVRNMGMVVGISVATTVLFMMMSQQAGHRVTSLIPGHPEIFLYGMRIVFILSSSICFAAALLTGYRLIKMRRSKLAKAQA